MNYREFVKQNFHKLPADMAAKDKMKKIGEMWRSQSGKQSMPKTTKAKKTMKATKATKAEGKGLLGMIFPPAQLLGLGVEPKKMKKAKGKGVAGGNVEGGGIISDAIFSAMGLGMPDKIKMKHLKRMTALEQKLHKDGKLTPAQHHKLKVYHNLHGAGFFDNLFSGVKKAAGAVINNLDTIKKVIPEAAKFVPAAAKLAPAVSKLEKIAPLASRFL